MTNTIRGCLFGLALLAGLLTPARADGKFIKVFLPDGASVTAELAATPAERSRGLMFRERIEADQGMLFIFDEEEMSSFWMLNCRFPIDILWLDKDRRVVHIEANVPPCPQEPCPTYPTPRPALYVLELKSGMAAGHKIKLFDRLEFVLPRGLKAGIT